jgi:hypothetical protein
LLNLLSNKIAEETIPEEVTKKLPISPHRDSPATARTPPILVDESAALTGIVQPATDITPPEDETGGLGGGMVARLLAYGETLMNPDPYVPSLR